MQIRRASFPANLSQPQCPFDHEKRPCLQKHGYYERYSQLDGCGKTRIQRFLCKFTGKTLSILPDQFLPYRLVNVALVQAHFDQIADSTSDDDPAECEVQRGCLRRAWKRFASTGRMIS